jgi:hypothetical protein
MTIQTFTIDVPEGHRFRYSFYKVKTLDPNYVECRGRKPPPPVIGEDGKAVVSPASKWKSDNKTHTKEYNKAYYAKKRELKKEPENPCTMVQKNRTTSITSLSKFFDLANREAMISAQWDIDKECCEMAEEHYKLQALSRDTILPKDPKVVRWEKMMDDGLRAVKEAGF